MAFSAQEGKGFFKDWLIYFANPLGMSRFLDVGCGAGWYGKIIREACHGVTVDAIDAFDEYVKRHNLCSIYNDIYIQDIRDVCNDVPQYDVIIMGDVLEHLEKEQAIRVVNALKKKCRFLWVALPVTMGRIWSTGYIQPDCDFEENIFNKHLHDWTGQEIQECFNPLWLVPYVQTGMFLVEGEL